MKCLSKEEEENACQEQKDNKTNKSCGVIRLGFVLMAWNLEYLELCVKRIDTWINTFRRNDEIQIHFWLFDIISLARVHPLSNCFCVILHKGPASLLTLPSLFRSLYEDILCLSFSSVRPRKLRLGKKFKCIRKADKTFFIDSTAKTFQGSFWAHFFLSAFRECRKKVEARKRKMFNKATKF